MNITEEIQRIRNARDTFRNRLVALGSATPTDNLAMLANTISNMAIYTPPNVTYSNTSPDDGGGGAS